jgi:hypothetical protein
LEILFPHGKQLGLMQEQPAILSDRFVRAIDYAMAIHATQVRKGTAVPYLAHLLGVASLVLEAEGDEDLAIAGLLHDAVEDCGGMPRLEDVRQRFGDRVARVILGCSDATDSREKKQQEYWERKRSYLDHLRDAEPDVLLVSLADKAHNARSIVTDIERHGVAILSKFNGAPQQILDYYSECLEIGRANGAHEALLTPLANSVKDITPSITPSSGTGKLDKQLSQEKKEQFLAVWQERRPEVLEWSDEEILYAMFVGM